MLRSSTARRLAAGIAILALAPAVVRAGGAGPAASPQVAAAIARAVTERFGSGARVEVVKLQTGSMLAEVRDSLVASPEPGARTDAPARFTMFAGGARLGSVVATVHVTATHVRVRRAMARHDQLTAGDLEEVTDALVGQPMRHLPTLRDVIGTRLKRNVVAGEPITATVIEVPTVVKSGEVLAVSVRIGAVDAEGRAVASGSGHVGDIIRVVPPGTKRPLKARILGPGRAEIIQ